MATVPRERWPRGAAFVRPAAGHLGVVAEPGARPGLPGEGGGLSVDRVLLSRARSAVREGTGGRHGGEGLLTSAHFLGRAGRWELLPRASANWRPAAEPVSRAFATLACTNVPPFQPEPDRGYGRPFSPQPAPYALLSVAWVPGFAGPSADKVGDRSPNPQWQVECTLAETLEQEGPQEEDDRTFPFKTASLIYVGQIASKTVLQAGEQESKDDLTPPLLKFICLLDRLDPGGEMILGGGKFPNACLLFCTIRSCCKGIF